MSSLRDSPFETLLDEALESWGFTRSGVIAEAESLPSEEWGYRPTEESRTVAELVLHIVESGLMAGGELTRPDGDFTRAPHAEILAEHAGHVADVREPDALLSLLRESFDDAERRIRDAGEIFMLQAINRFDGEAGTRLAWLWHAVDHESYHRGQLALMVRMTGRTPALTRAIRGE